METLIDVVSSLGFPVAIAIYALYNSYKHDEFLQNTLRSSLKDNTDAINKLSDLIDKVLLSK